MAGAEFQGALHKAEQEAHNILIGLMFHRLDDLAESMGSVGDAEVRTTIQGEVAAVYGAAEGGEGRGGTHRCGEGDGGEF